MVRGLFRHFLKGRKMFDNVFDAIEQHWVEFVATGAILLVAAFVLSFCYRTCWSQWKDRAKDKQIYGKPRAKRSNLMRGNKTRHPKR